MPDNIKPIFVVGSARSGTTMIAKLLSSSKYFYEYRAETLLMTVCRKRYGDIFNSLEKRQDFLRDWFRSRQFSRSNLTKLEFKNILEESVDYSDLLINFLSEMARKSQKEYIVDSTPANLSFINEILESCPVAKFILIVRDGRDVSLSQEKLGWIAPPILYRSRADKLNYAMLAWKLTNKYSFYEDNSNVLVIKYEDFLAEPSQELETIAKFIGCNASCFDLGSVHNPIQPNSAFGRLGSSGNNSTIARWKNIEPELLADFTFGCNKILKAFRYPIIKSSFSFGKLFRYVIFSAHLQLKRYLKKIHYFAKHTSERIEVDKK